MVRGMFVRFLVCVCMKAHACGGWATRGAVALGSACDWSYGNHGGCSPLVLKMTSACWRGMDAAPTMGDAGS
eukprot:5789671-Pyramimonas_sp.AAC.1